VSGFARGIGQLGSRRRWGGSGRRGVAVVRAKQKTLCERTKCVEVLPRA
jgi:hypothetical protein